MRADLLDWVTRHSRWRHAAGVRLLETLADLADETGYLTASDRELAHRCNSSRKGITKARARLVEVGALETVPRRGSNGATLSNGYRIVLTRTPPTVTRPESRPGSLFP